MNIALVEDNGGDKDLIVSCLDKYFKEKGIEYAVTHFKDGDMFLASYSPVYDIVFMDIEFPTGNGLEISAKLRKLDKKVLLIFVTNMAQFAVRGYEVEALAYVVKPVAYSMLSLVLDRALTRIENGADKHVILKKDGVTLRLSISQIKYVEVVDHELIYHTVEKDVALRGSLNNVEKEFVKFGFFRCNRYAIVNLKYVTGVKEYEIRIGNDERVAISHSRRQALLKTLAEYYARGGSV